MTNQTTTLKDRIVEKAYEAGAAIKAEQGKPAPLFPTSDSDQRILLAAAREALLIAKERQRLMSCSCDHILDAVLAELDSPLLAGAPSRQQEDATLPPCVNGTCLYSCADDECKKAVEKGIPWPPESDIEWRLVKAGDVAPVRGGHGSWVETNHPAVIDCMGSAPECAENGCQLRNPSRQQEDEQTDHGAGLIHATDTGHGETLPRPNTGIPRIPNVWENAAAVAAPHFWTPDPTKRFCTVCGDNDLGSVWGIHRFQIQPGDPDFKQETK